MVAERLKSITEQLSDPELLERVMENHLFLLAGGFLVFAVIAQLGFLQMIKSLMWQAVVEVCLLAIMAASAVAVFYHSIDRAYPVLGISSIREVPLALVDGRLSSFSDQKLDVASDIAVVLSVWIVLFSYLYCSLPATLIPSWLPVVGKLDTWLFTLLGFVGLLACAAAMYYQFHFTSETITHGLVSIWKYGLRWLHEFWLLSIDDKVTVTIHYLADGYNWVITTFHI